MSKSCIAKSKTTPTSFILSGNLETLLQEIEINFPQSPLIIEFLAKDTTGLCLYMTYC